jgi:hypothetical protein
MSFSDVCRIGLFLPEGAEAVNDMPRAYVLTGLHADIV